MSANADAPKLAAIRAVFSAMFDAVDVAGDFDESKWIDLIAAFNAVGRLVFGWPHLESSAGEPSESFAPIRVEMPESISNAFASDPCPDCRHDLQHLAGECPEPDCECGTEPEGVADYSAAVVAAAVPLPVEQAPSRIEPVRPNEQDELLFAAVRGDPSISMAAAEREAGLAQRRGIQRLNLLNSYGTLPDDIKQWREARSKARGVPRGVSSLYMHQEGKRPAPTSISEALSGESFEDRRKQAAHEATERTWRERHPETASS